MINVKSVEEIAKQLGFEWSVLAYELGFTRNEVRQFQATSKDKKVQAQRMLESWCLKLI